MEVKGSNIKIQHTVQKQEMKDSAEKLISFQVKFPLFEFHYWYFVYLMQFDCKFHNNLKIFPFAIYINT